MRFSGLRSSIPHLTGVYGLKGRAGSGDQAEESGGAKEHWNGESGGWMGAGY